MLRWILAIIGAIVIGMLGVLVLDTSMALDQSRSQNRFLTQKCLALAQIASQAWKGQASDPFLARLDNATEVEWEGETIRLDDSVVLKVVDGKILSVDAATCD